MLADDRQGLLNQGREMVLFFGRWFVPFFEKEVHHRHALDRLKPESIVKMARFRDLGLRDEHPKNGSFTPAAGTAEPLTET